MPRDADGRVLLAAAAVNCMSALLAALSLLFFPVLPGLAWVHVLLFAAMPLVGFIWFKRDSVRPRLFWQKVASLTLQAFLAVLPWVTLLASVLRAAPAASRL